MDELRDLLERRCGRILAAPFDPARPVVRLHEPTYGSDEICAALDCLLSVRITMGERVRTFEREFSSRFGHGRSVMVNSGSSANLLAVSALANPACREGLRPGDEVIVPALCWSTTVWPLVQNQLVPVIVDIDPATFNLDANEAARAVGPKTRGLLIVPIYGNPCDMAAVTDLTRARDLVLIEDSCESLGARFGGKHVGSFGRVGTFSFYYSHHISTMEGGMCVTDDVALAELMRILRAHGWVREVEDPEPWLRRHPEIDPRFLFVNLGYNLRPTELQGAMGSAQLGKLEDFIRVRRDNAAWFRRELAEFEGCFTFQEETRGGTSSWFGFPMTVRAGARFEVKDLMAFLAGRGIETRPLNAGNIALQPAMQLFPHRVHGDLRHATHAMRRGFTFGCHHGVDARAREHVAKAVRDFVRSRG